MNDAAVAFAKRLLSAPDLLVDDVKASTPQQHENAAKALLTAVTNPDTNDFDALVAVAAKLLRTNERLPAELATFAADKLEGKRKRPTKRGSDKYDNWERDYKYWRAIQEVAKAFNLPRYSNNGVCK
ncbi:MAG: hypothetical protein ACOY5W_04960 [Pseudomonadota bacterium]